MWKRGGRKHRHDESKNRFSQLCKRIRSEVKYTKSQYMMAVVQL